MTWSILFCDEALVAEYCGIARKNPRAYVEMKHKLGQLCKNGLAGENKIGVCDEQFGIYLIEPTAPGLRLVVCHVPNANDNLQISAIVSNEPISQAVQLELVINAGKVCNFRCIKHYII